MKVLGPVIGLPTGYQLLSGMAGLILVTLTPKLNPIVVRSIQKPLLIQASVMTPPRQAFEEMNRAAITPPAAILQEFSDAARKPSLNLNQWLIQARQIEGRQVWDLPHKVVIHIPTLKISADKALAFLREAELKNHKNQEQDQQLLAGLSLRERDRLEAAKSRGLDWSDVHDVREAGEPPPEVATNLLKIQGQLRLQPGLALGDRAIEVRHFIEGVPQETGLLDPTSGSFQIRVADNRGELRAMIRDHNGTTIATARTPLNGVPPATAMEMMLRDRGHLAANFVDFNKSPQRILSTNNNSQRGVVADVMIASLGVEQSSDALGSLRYPNVAESSWALTRVRAPGFREATLIQPAGEDLSLALLPEKMLKTLAQLTSDSVGTVGSVAKVATVGGMIFGQVLSEGKPVAGVQLALENEPEAKVTYLQGFIPQSLPATAAGGYFAFQNLEPGFYQVTASKEGVVVGHFNAVVDENAVAVGNIEMTTQHSTTEIKVFDAFTGTPIAAHLDLQSLPQSVATPVGASVVDLPQLHRLSLGYAYPEGEDFVPAQFLYSDDQGTLNLPQVRRAWLQNLATQRAIAADPESGIIVGFVNSEVADTYEVYLSHETHYSEGWRVYFDSSGQVTPTLTAGGGYVFFNVPANVQSVVVVPQKTEIIHTQVVPVDAGSTSVLTTSL